MTDGPGDRAQTRADVDFGALVLELVDAIPAGSVLTYGDVAALLGSRAARAVGTVLARSGGGHPWWRVVGSGGHPVPALAARARTHYEHEGTPLTASTKDAGYRVNYALAKWNASR